MGLDRFLKPTRKEHKPVNPIREHPAVNLARTNAFKQSKTDVVKLFLPNYEPPDLAPRCEASDIQHDEPEDIEDASALVDWYARCTRRLGHGFLKKCLSAVGKRLVLVWRHYPSRGVAKGGLVLPDINFEIAEQAIPIPIEKVSDEDIARQQLVDFKKAIEGNQFMVYVAELCISQVEDLYGS